MRLLTIAALLVTGDLTGACAAPQNGNGRVAGPLAAQPAGIHVTDAQLPINQRFKTLDDYLLWLEKTQAPIDRAWYKEVRPGVYELQTGNFRSLDGQPQKRTFTREELEKQFGFSR